MSIGPDAGPDDLDLGIAQPGAGRRLLVVGGLWTAASQLLPAVGTAVLSVVAARLLGSDALGRQSLIAYVNMAIAALVVSSLGSAVVQQLGYLLGTGDRVRFIALGAWFRRVAATLGVVLAVIMTSIGLVTGRDRLAWAVIGVVAVADAAADGIAARILTEEGFAPVSRIRLAFQVLGPPIGIVAVVIGLGIPGIFAGDGLAALGLWFALTRRQRRRRGRGRSAGGAEAWSWRPPVPVGRRFSLFALNELINQVVARRVEFVVLAALSTSREIAMYSVAFITIGLVATLPGAIASAALPLVAAAEGSGSIRQAARHLHYAVRLGTLLCLPLTALVGALGPALVLLVYGRAFEDAARLVPLAALALLVPVLSTLCTQWWSGRGRLAVVLATGGLAAVVDIAVAAALAGRYGALGAVIGKLAGTIAFAAGLLIVTTRRTGDFGWRLRGLAITAGISLLAAVLARLAADAGTAGGLLPQLLSLVGGGLVGLAVLALGGALFPVLETDESNWLRPIVPARLHRVLHAVTR